MTTNERRLGPSPLWWLTTSPSPDGVVDSVDRAQVLGLVAWAAVTPSAVVVSAPMPLHGGGSIGRMARSRRRAIPQVIIIPESEDEELMVIL